MQIYNGGKKGAETFPTSNLGQKLWCERMGTLKHAFLLLLENPNLTSIRPIFKGKWVRIIVLQDGTIFFEFNSIMYRISKNIGFIKYWSYYFKIQG